jgi:YD repeat-containing protein
MKTCLAIALALALMTGALPAPDAHAVEVPLAVCIADGFNCPGTGEPYHGPTPTSWEAAAQVFCSRFAAAHRASGNCPCDGTLCSTTVTCTLVRTVTSGFVGGDSAAGATALEARDNSNGVVWGGPNALFSSPTCGCPAGSGLTLAGTCLCNGPSIWNGSSCVPRFTCTNIFLDSCNPPGTVIPKNKGKPCDKGQCTVGDPYDPGTGINTQTESIYRSPTLALTLRYNSPLVGEAIPARPFPFGQEWTFGFGMRVAQFSAGSVGVTRPDGRYLQFRAPVSGNTYVSDADIDDRLTKLVDGSGQVIGWSYTAAADDSIEHYDASGSLLSITTREGLTTSLAYSDASTPPAVAGRPGLLIQVTDPFGRALQFTYDFRYRVVGMTDPAGGQYVFAYDEASSVVLSGHAVSNNLTSVTFPDGRKRVYFYNEQAHTQNTNLPTSLTGIVDEDGNRFATLQYDAQGRTVSTQHAGGAELTRAVYSTGSTAVTSALGTTRAYASQTVLGVTKTPSITGPACPSCGPASQVFDANGNVASRTDWNGHVTNYGYDRARNLETSRTEAAGTPQARTISTQWHPVFRLRTAVAEPLRITRYVYNGDSGASCGVQADGTTLVPGVLCSKAVQPTSDVTGAAGFGAAPSGAPRIWSYTYDRNGSVLTVDGPRIDAVDVTTYAYYANDDPDVGKRGKVAAVTNALGQVTSITAYNGHGQPAAITDPNGLITSLGYDARQRLVTRNVGGETTAYDYDFAGQLIKVTLPDGSFLQYTYDAAHRLTGISDIQGNRIAYALDAMGNRTREDVFDPANALAQTRSRAFDALNRLAQEIGAANQTTAYAYDDQGNVTSVTDPLTHVTTNGYDALNRLVRVTDPGQGVTLYGYNGIDQLTRVTDPRSLVTTYNYDGLGNLDAQLSPDTGAATNTYDAAGNLLTQTDAKGQTTTYAYDALNRATSIVFADGSRQVYTYDAGTNGVGRLTGIAEFDPAGLIGGRIAYAYDLHGRVTQETRTLAGVAYTTAYRYDAAGRMTGVTYPSGRQVAYTLDTMGRIFQVTTTPPGGAEQPVAADVAYQPFGGVKGYALGNGRQVVRGHDQDGRIASYTLGAQTFAIGYDAASRVSFISDAANPANANTYGYDALDRLTSAAIPNNQYAYVYDAVGNRTTKTVGSSTDTYAYDAASNRIAGITSQAGATRFFAFDPNGSTTDDGVNQYVYDARGRMVQSIGALGTTSYQVNALGQRVRKTISTDDRIFHYDTKGRLIAESDPGGGIKREYIYLGDIPVAVVQ